MAGIEEVKRPATAAMSCYLWSAKVVGEGGRQRWIHRLC